jgi:hypothetical protein
MTTYDVRLHREIMLTFYDIEANSPEGAANIARDGLAKQADDIDDCDDLYAQVIVVEGEPHSPVNIVFEAGKSNQAAAKLLAALEGALYALDENRDGSGPSKQTAIANALVAIAEAKAAGIAPTLAEPAPLQEGRQP